MISTGMLLGERYEVRAPLAHGGMSEVFVAHDELLERDVAVKVMRGDTADSRRFEAEVRLLARLDHPSLVKVFDVGELDDRPYVVMELVGGTTLAALLADGPIDAERTRSLGLELSDSLAYLHAEGVVHRDVKPSNILVDEHGRARLTDFGIARLVDSTRVTATGLAMGTPRYAAPEQVEGDVCGPEADIYSLGLVLAESLTGRAPFEGTGTEVALARLRRAPDALAFVPSDWQTLLREMTAREPLDRPTASAVREQLGALPSSTDATQRTTVAAAPAVPEPAVLPTRRATAAPAVDPRRGRRFAALAAALAVLALLGLAFMMLPGGANPAPLTTARSTDPPATTAPATTAPPTIAAVPALVVATDCPSLEQQKKNLDAQRHLVDQQYKGAGAAGDAAKKALEQQRHDVDQALKQCH